jgi:2,3,4,5-tetrahydropyridine-2-carboxylate N-succinyltransferase
MPDLTALIEDLWDRRGELTPADTGAATVVGEAIRLLDIGAVRVAEVVADGSEYGTVKVHDWLKKAILLTFRLSAMQTMEVGPFEYVDKLPLKRDFEAAGVRVVPGASARVGAHLEPGVIMMPSYVNIGAYVGSGTMVDTWATVGSCAQIGKNVHLSGGVGIGGVIEPPQAAPVVIEDECLIGSRCIVAEGARVGTGSVLGAGAILTATIPVFDAATGKEISRGFVPPWSVAVAATRPREWPGGTFGMPCVLVIKRLTEGERHDKAKLNDLLRESCTAL